MMTFHAKPNRVGPAELSTEPLLAPKQAPKDPELDPHESRSMLNEKESSGRH
jgi:hypothetical protein